MDLKSINFTVLLPILERKDIIEGFPLSLESIFSNTLVPDQVVVTVDGLVSQDFKKIILYFQNKFSLDIVWIETKVGLDKALNMGLEKCRNEIIFRADGDDINLKDRFAIQLPILLNGCDVVGSYVDEYDEKGIYLSTREVPISSEKIFKKLVYRNPMNHMTVGFRKSSLLEVGGYPELFLKGDYGLWIKLMAQKKIFKNVDLSLVKAVTGKRMIKDRGGLKYVASEFLLQKYLLNHGFSNIFFAFFLFISRSIVFLSPYKIRNLFYRLFLR